MADPLDNARAMMDMIFTAIKLEGGNVNTVHGTDIVLAYAAIAQAEQLKRIGDILSIYLNDYDPNGNEAQGVTTEDIGY